MTKRLQQIGLTPAKAALMAVLAIGLVVVWGPALKGFFSSGRSNQTAAKPPVPSARSAPLRRSTAALRPKPSSLAKRSESPAQQPRPLPTITVAEASAYDPFAPPRWSPSAKRLVEVEREAIEPSELESRFGTLRQTGVAMILVSRDGQAAQVGDRTLRIGDTIDGFEVVAITADGVTFKPAPRDDEGDARGA